MKTTRKQFGIVAGLAVAASGFSLPAQSAKAEDFSDPSVNQYWGESWTDSTGTYNSPDQSKNSVAGGVLTAVIPTDGNMAFPDNEVTNYIRVRSDLPGASTHYAGDLLGNVSSNIGYSATFSLNNSTLAPGAQFDSSQFVGENTGSGPATPMLRLVFTGGTGLVNANGAGDLEPNIWWSDAAFATPTSMFNGQEVTIGAAFDPSAWSNIDGKLGTDPLVAGQFQSALQDVTLAGISFGSGFFYSDGFSFNTGGAASLQLDSFNNVPEPASFSLLGVGALALLRRRRRA
jgi:hypothetical protein